MITFFTCCYVPDISSHCVWETKALQQLTSINLDLMKCSRQPIHKTTRVLSVRLRCHCRPLLTNQMTRVLTEFDGSRSTLLRI
jgi:hypothetical protein